MVLGCTIAQLLCAVTATLCPFSKTLINTGEAIKAYTSKLNAFYLFPFTHLKVCNVFFWGELIDKHKDINANSKTVFTDYAMLKLVHIVPIYF